MVEWRVPGFCVPDGAGRDTPQPAWSRLAGGASEGGRASFLVLCGLSAGCQARGLRGDQASRPSGPGWGPASRGERSVTACATARGRSAGRHAPPQPSRGGGPRHPPVAAVGPPCPGLLGVTLGPRGVEGCSVGRPGVSSRCAGRPRCDERLRHVRGRGAGSPAWPL